jgi:hypothetical protein
MARDKTALCVSRARFSTIIECLVGKIISGEHQFGWSSYLEFFAVSNGNE